MTGRTLYSRVCAHLAIRPFNVYSQAHTLPESTDPKPLEWAFLSLGERKVWSATAAELTKR